MSIVKLYISPLILCVSLISLGACHSVISNSAEDPRAPSSELKAMWEVYKKTNIQQGRVISWDEDGITTSEGQSYALLRAVASDDAATFDEVWRWTHEHLQVRLGDNLFSWKWKDQVLGTDAAMDADTDIALALILASRRFHRPEYLQSALPILDSIWKHEVVKAGEMYYITAGNWAAAEKFPTIHVGYLAPYAYQVFARIDKLHEWSALIDSSYRLLHWIYFTVRLTVPPELVYIDPQSGNLLLSPPDKKPADSFSYDAFPLFWRVAVDAQINHRHEGRLRRHMLRFFKNEWKQRGLFYDHYDVQGHPLSDKEAMPLYATMHALALVQNPSLAQLLETRKLAGLRTNARAGKDTPYYLQNWLWFDQAFEEGLILVPQ